MLLTYLALAASPITTMPAALPADSIASPRVEESVPAKEQPKIDCAKAARDKASHGSKPRRSSWPTDEEAYGCSPNELYPEAERRLIREDTTSKDHSPSVDELVMQGITGKEGIQIAPSDSRPAGEQAPLPGVSAAAYDAAREADDDTNAEYVAPPEAPLGPITTGIIGAVLGSLGMLAWSRRKGRRNPENEAGVRPL